MPRQHTVTLYKFDELSAKAQQKAMDKHRERDYPHDMWSEATMEDAKEIATLLGFSPVNIYWSGFGSQGDGACVTGAWTGSDLNVKALKEHAPQDETLHAIANNLATFVGRFPQIATLLAHRGNYYHSHSIDFDTTFGYDDEGGELYSHEDDINLRRELRNFMNWIYDRLENDYNWYFEDDQVKEDIRNGDYEFREDGSVYRG